MGSVEISLRFHTHSVALFLIMTTIRIIFTFTIISRHLAYSASDKMRDISAVIGSGKSCGSGPNLVCHGSLAGSFANVDNYALARNDGRKELVSVSSGFEEAKKKQDVIETCNFRGRSVCPNEKIEAPDFGWPALATCEGGDIIIYNPINGISFKYKTSREGVLEYVLTNNLGTVYKKLKNKLIRVDTP